MSSNLDWFNELERKSFAGPEGAICYREVGEGPPLLLLHGYPQAGMMWADCLSQLSVEYHCVVPDLRGYGNSFKPAPVSDNSRMSFRSMAADQVALMRTLGFEYFAVAGHDRGARTAHRLALDHPEAVRALVILDITPTLHIYETLSMRSAMAYFHWLLLPQPYPLPEKMITGEEAMWISACLDKWGLGGNQGSADFFSDGQRDAYTAFLRDPACLRATTDDYRAAAGIDLDHDRASRAAGQVIQCDSHVLWGGKGLFAQEDVVGIWQAHSAEGAVVTGCPTPTGHFIPEEAPNLVCEEVLSFLTRCG